MTSTYPVLTDREDTHAGSLPDPSIAGLDVLAPMRVTAVRALRQHISGGQGQCVVCGSVWPCQRAIQAEHNLAAHNEPSP